MKTNNRHQERFFQGFAVFILIFVITSFLGKAILDTRDLPPLTVLHHFHAVTMGVWFVLFAPLMHHLVVHRRVHPATWVGLGLLLTAVVLILGLSGNEAWFAMLESVLGPRGGVGHG